jgi:hypothetical protein
VDTLFLSAIDVTVPMEEGAGVGVSAKAACSSGRKGGRCRSRSLMDWVDLDQDGMRLSIKLPLSNAESGARDGWPFGAAMSGVLPSRFRHEMTPLPGIGSQ